MKLRANLLTTTALTTLQLVHNENASLVDSRLAQPVMRRSHNQGAAIHISRPILVPTLSDQDITTINNYNGRYITRHIPRRLLPITLEGSFRFGSIASYRPKDSQLHGRFSDYQEGRQREIFRSHSGIYNVKVEGVNLSDVRISGFENPIVIIYEVNDLCSCSSIGEFSSNRAATLRSRGNGDVNAYVVYDVGRLITAISDILAEHDDTANMGIIVRKVVYGEKDRHWVIQDRYENTQDRDFLAVWLGNVFVKSLDYIHEEEVRIVITDKDRAGQLSDAIDSKIFKDERIAAAIVAHGNF